MAAKHPSKKRTATTQLASIPLMQLATGFWVSKTLAAAMDLDLFSHLAGRSVTTEDLSRSLRLEPRPAEMLLSACTALGRSSFLNRNPVRCTRELLDISPLWVHVYS